MACGLLAGDSTEGRPDRHADAGDVALAEYVAGHDLARGKDVVRRPAVVEDHLRALVYRDAEVRECDAGPQWIRKERWRIKRPRPMRLGRRQALRRAVVEHGVIEASRADRGVERRHRRLKRGGIELQRKRELPDRRRPDWREHRRHEFPHRLGVDDRIADLVWLPGNKAPPDRVALGPEILALVVEALRALVDDDPERYAI